MNKAQRGELGLSLPAGLVYDLDERVQLDPDKQVHDALRLLFETFQRTGSALACVKHFRQHGIKFPTRPLRCAKRGDLVWLDLGYSRVLTVLHNPRYAGAFTYGRSSFRKDIDGKSKKTKKKETSDWLVLIKDCHPGYISWEDFERNRKTLFDNSLAHSKSGVRGPAREGNALLQGLALCGLCGRRMTIRYHFRRGRISPDYLCQREGIECGKAKCQSIPGDAIDQTIGRVIVDSMTPSNIETAVRVHDEIKRRLGDADALRRKDVERAQYDVDVARRRYMHVDPSNRLVADSLEADWNAKLRKLRDTQEAYDKSREADVLRLSEEIKVEITNLASSFPKLWCDPRTSDKDRKRMARLVVQDVTMRKEDKIYLGIQFRGGAVRELVLPVPKGAFDECKTHSQIVDDIDRMLETHSDHEIATIFNERGWLTGKGLKFDRNRVERIRAMYSLKTRFDRLRERGWLTLQELATRLGVTRGTVQRWADDGRIETKTYKKKLRLYGDPGEHAPKPMPRAERLLLAKHARMASMGISQQ